MDPIDPSTILAAIFPSTPTSIPDLRTYQTTVRRNLLAHLQPPSSDPQDLPHREHSPIPPDVQEERLNQINTSLLPALNTKWDPKTMPRRSLRPTGYYMTVAPSPAPSQEGQTRSAQLGSGKPPDTIPSKVSSDQMTALLPPGYKRCKAHVSLPPDVKQAFRALRLNTTFESEILNDERRNPIRKRVWKTASEGNYGAEQPPVPLPNPLLHSPQEPEAMEGVAVAKMFAEDITPPPPKQVEAARVYDKNNAPPPPPEQVEGVRLNLQDDTLRSPKHMRLPPGDKAVAPSAAKQVQGAALYNRDEAPLPPPEHMEGVKLYDKDHAPPPPHSPPPPPPPPPTDQQDKEMPDAMGLVQPPTHQSSTRAHFTNPAPTSAPFINPSPTDPPSINPPATSAYSPKPPLGPSSLVPLKRKPGTSVSPHPSEEGEYVPPAPRPFARLRRASIESVDLNLDIDIDAEIGGKLKVDTTAATIKKVKDMAPAPKSAPVTASRPPLGPGSATSDAPGSSASDKEKKRDGGKVRIDISAVKKVKDMVPAPKTPASKTPASKTSASKTPAPKTPVPTSTLVTASRPPMGPRSKTSDTPVSRDRDGGRALAVDTSPATVKKANEMPPAPKSAPITASRPPLGPRGATLDTPVSKNRDGGRAPAIDTSDATVKKVKDMPPAPKSAPVTATRPLLGPRNGTWDYPSSRGRNRGRGRGSGRDRGRSEERYRDRSEDRYRDRYEDRYRDRSEDRYRDRSEDRYRDRSEDRYRDRSIDRYRDRYNYRGGDRYDGRDRVRYHDRDRDRYDDSDRDRYDDRDIDHYNGSDRDRDRDRSSDRDRSTDRSSDREYGFSIRGAARRDDYDGTHEDDRRISRRDEERRSSLPTVSTRLEDRITDKEKGRLEDRITDREESGSVSGKLEDRMTDKEGRSIGFNRMGSYDAARDPRRRGR